MPKPPRGESSSFGFATVSTIDASATELPSDGPSSTANSESRPSVHTTSFHQQSFHSTEAQNQSQNADDVTVSADQERQVLLLMLLAQVCALHDPTPKTFTIHVVELFERGILDRESIHFLYELGLVPSISPTVTTRLLTASETTTTTKKIKATANGESIRQTSSAGLEETSSNNSSLGKNSVASAACEEIANELALTTTNTTTKLAAVFATSGDPHRSAEAFAIRKTLERYEQIQQRLSDAAQGNDTSNEDAAVQPWDVKHFPLSLSRYQREFIQIAMLASGSFGQVFHATRKMDGCDYAIKKVDFDATGYSNDTIREVIREVECLAKVSDHPNVVRYYTSWLEPSWMTGGQTVEARANNTSPSVSPSSAKQRRQQQRRLLLTNKLKDLINPGSQSDDEGGRERRGSPTNKPSSRLLEKLSFEASEGSSSGLWQRRRFSFGSSVDSSDQSWESYNDQAMEQWRGASFGDDESSVLFIRKGPNPQDVASHPGQGKGRQHQSAYRYQISLYIQMQLCHPASLADWIRERNSKVAEKNYKERMGPALEIFEQIVRGLAHVHEKGIIHRDLKPANIFASKDGQVIKIGDFGLSKQLMNLNRNGSKNGEKESYNPLPPMNDTDDCQVMHTSTSHHEHWHNAKKGVMIPRPNNPSAAITQFRKPAPTTDHLLTVGIGTRSYAAPEQLQTKSYSTAADVFSLGLIFLELVCCFETEHERLHNFQQCRQQQGVQQWLVDLYPEIATIILACTQQDPDQRPSAPTILAMLSLRQAKISTSNALVPTGTSPKGELHNALLRRSLERRDLELEEHRRELAKKDKEIETLRREMERMKTNARNLDPGADPYDTDQID